MIACLSVDGRGSILSSFISGYGYLLEFYKFYSTKALFRFPRYGIITVLKTQANNPIKTIISTNTVINTEISNLYIWFGIKTIDGISWELYINLYSSSVLSGVSITTSATTLAYRFYD